MAELWEQFQHRDIAVSHLQMANEFLGKDIQASLKLGDLNLLENEMDWLSGLLKTHNIPEQLLPSYIKHYRQAVESNLDQRGQPVIEWLDKIDSTS